MIVWERTSTTVFLFGGFGYGLSASVVGYCNDLWMYNMGNDGWTMQSGNIYCSPDSTAPYDTTQNNIADPLAYHANNFPAGLGYGVGWTDSFVHNYWGGDSGVFTSDQFYNDLWKLRESPLEWKHEFGSDIQGATGVIGKFLFFFSLRINCYI